MVLVKTVIPTEADLRITLRDPTGEMEGALHRKAIESHPSIISGAVIVLEQVFYLFIHMFFYLFFFYLFLFNTKTLKVSVFSPSPVTHYLNIVSKNIIHVYTPTINELAEAKAEFKVIKRSNYFKLLILTPFIACCT